jgi:predicted nucleic acid-binding protein
LGLGELDLLLQRELGVAATEAVLQALVSDAIRLVPPTRDDLARAIVLLQEAAEHRPRLADALLVATAERLGVRRVAAFDRRPLAVFRPRHVRALDFEP